MIRGQAESAIPSPNPLAAQPVKGEEAASAETASCIRKEASRQPILKPQRDDQILIANCV
jgi:hypothetical protein